jgi:hypothetical protein
MINFSPQIFDSTKFNEIEFPLFCEREFDSQYLTNALSLEIKEFLPAQLY